MVVLEEWNTILNTTAVVLVIDTAAPEGSYAWHYTYDDLGQMTSACSDWRNGECAGNAWQYRHDGAGNFLLFDHWDTSTGQTVTAQYVINGANQVECIDDASGDGRCDDGEFLWEYNAYGQLIDDGVTHYEYDAAGRLWKTTIGQATTI